MHGHMPVAHPRHTRMRCTAPAFLSCAVLACLTCDVLLPSCGATSVSATEQGRVQCAEGCVDMLSRLAVAHVQHFCSSRGCCCYCSMRVCQLSVQYRLVWV